MQSGRRRAELLQLLAKQLLGSRELPSRFLYLGKIKANLGKEFAELLRHFPVFVPNHVRVAHSCARVSVPQTILSHLHPSSARAGDRAGLIAVAERMRCPLQAELLQDGLQPPFDEIVGGQATTFAAQEKWLFGIPSIDVEPQALCKLRGKSEESPLAVLRPLQLAFPPAALHGDRGSKLSFYWKQRSFAAQLGLLSH